MNNTFSWKLGLIVATLLVFAYGIFGIPKSLTPDGLLAAMHERIHLGLDLRGGTHLILQVQVNDAVNADSDRAMERLKDVLRDDKITYTDVVKPDALNAPEKVVIKGITPDGTTALRNGVSDKLPEYDLTSGAENTWVLAMKPSLLSDLAFALTETNHRLYERLLDDSPRYAGTSRLSEFHLEWCLQLVDKLLTGNPEVN